MEEKNELDALREKLLYKQKQGYDIIDVDERIKLEEYATAYKAYLNAARTEREAVTEAIAQAEALGFVPYERGMVLEPGTKIYKSVRGKALMLAVMGRETLDHGANIAAAHVDSPRLDLKPIPLYEKDEICLLKTHYYGGIKKYQWVAIPLEIHGVVTKKDGETVEVVIGKDPEDPKFTITDLLPHLAKDQMAKHGSDIIPGEYLNLLAGSVPYAGEGTKRVMLAVMSLLNDRYDITEEDFLSAELEVVPSFEACDIGVDRSFIGGYGQDDRVCAFAELKAIFDTETPDRTAVCLSTHVIIVEVLKVIVALIPNRNGARANYGVGICKFTGSRGKSGSNDASAEVVGKLRKIFADNRFVWHMSELGKVDQGGGGTVAQYMANRNIDTIDAGTPVFSMHAPFETVTKFDCYQTYKAMWAFYKDR